MENISLYKYIYLYIYVHKRGGLNAEKNKVEMSDLLIGYVNLLITGLLVFLDELSSVIEMGFQQWLLIISSVFLRTEFHVKDFGILQYICILERGLNADKN